MSKLGIHVSSGDRHGFGDLLRTCANAGSPVPSFSVSVKMSGRMYSSIAHKPR